MTKLSMNKDPREEKRQMARAVRQRLADNNVYALNLISSPGSGKTTLLEKALPLLAERFRLHVIEADTATRNDADRLEKAGLAVEMIANAITGCHISPAAGQKAFDALDLSALDLVVIENVGNLVCPSGVDLGEDDKVVMVSVAEGEDKPLKYPNIFRNSSLALINKIDAADALDADMELLERNITAINPGIECIRLSARTGVSVDRFVEWVAQRVTAKLPS